MNILHYIMGIPPIRDGGAIKYAIDLAEQQQSFCHNVFLIYPGAINLLKKTYIRERKTNFKIKCFEIMNPLPVPGALGICNEKHFIKHSDKKVYYKFLKGYDIDIIHFHSVQGLHIELLEAADELHVKKIFTSHDYYGICPKTDLMYGDKICSDTKWYKCEQCCTHPDSYVTLIRRQSHWFRNIVKCTPLLVSLGFVWNIISKTNNEPRKEEVKYKENIHESYFALKNYYLEIFRRIDMMHYNSTIARKKYEEFLGERAFFLEGVVHKNIIDKRERRGCGNVIRFGYLGNGGGYKGFPLLIEALDSVYGKSKIPFLLNIYFPNSFKRKYIIEHKRYQYSDIDEVFHNMDVLLVPSLWAETYGFVVLEAVMHGVPVVITSNVGARDFVEKYEKAGKVINPDKNDLINILLSLLNNKEEIDKMNKCICALNININFEEHVRKILTVYKKGVSQEMG